MTPEDIRKLNPRTKEEALELYKQFDSKDMVTYGTHKVQTHQWTWSKYNEFVKFWTSLHPWTIADKAAGASTVDPVMVTVEEIEAHYDFDTAPILKRLQSDYSAITGFIFQILADREPHPSEQLYEAVYDQWPAMKNKWHELRKVISDIRDVVGKEQPGYEIPEGTPGVSAIYQIKHK